VLFQKAEDMNIPMPLKNNPEKSPDKPSDKNLFENLYEKYKHRDPFVVKNPTVKQRKWNATTTFTKANAAAFEPKNGEYFFDNAERSRMVRRILQLTSFTREETPKDIEEHEDDTTLEVGHGIEQLCYDKVYESYYPIHDGPLISRDNHKVSRDNHKVSHDDDMISRDDNVDNDRQILQKDWASFSMTFKYQPLDAIRDYFGVRVSFYFAWLGVYTAFLVPAAVVGFLCFLYALATMMSSEPLKEICDESNERYTRKNAQVVTNLQQTCSNVVPTTCQQDVFALLVPRLLTSCQRLVDKLATRLLSSTDLVTSCSNNLLSSCNSKICQQVVSDNLVAT
jgi:hypothetical protein